MVPRGSRSLSGSPAFDGLFTSIWFALASIQLFMFLMRITVMTVGLGPFATGILFAVLVVLFTATIAMMMGALDRQSH